MSGFETVGKLAWDVVTANRPTVNEESNFVSVIPKGAEWTELSAPAGSNHINWAWWGPGVLMHDFMFRLQLEWSYGVRCRGGGAYLTNAVVRVLEHNIGIGGYNISLVCQVGQIDNAGDDRAPVPRIPIDVSLSYTNWLWGGGGTSKFVIQGDGNCTASYAPSSYQL